MADLFVIGQRKPPAPTAADVQLVVDATNALLDLAAERGLVVSIERQSVPPLAMGRHRANVSIWPMR